MAFLQSEYCDHHWLTKGTFYMKIPACGILRDTPKLCLPMWRGILCRACSSDSPLQDCPRVLMTPWPSVCLGMGCQCHQFIHTYRTYKSIHNHSLSSVGAAGNSVLLDASLFSESAHEEDSCEMCLSLCLG